MKNTEIRLLLRNLVNRIETQVNGSGRLGGILTADEVQALRSAVEILGNEPMANGTDESSSADPPVSKERKPDTQLNVGALSPTPLPDDMRLCLDFGTAMSKATLVRDGENGRSEEIHVLQLGIPGDQQEISDSMLVSSVYIDNEGVLWFGQAAVERSLLEGGDGTRQRLDNIKRRLSEDGMNEQVEEIFNPTRHPVTYKDMLLAYLTFMTWTVSRCLKDIGYDTHLSRRFALPCLTGQKRRKTIDRLKQLIGESQVLADTFGDELREGLPLEKFLVAVDDLRSESREYPFVAQDVTEPLAIAGSMMSWEKQVDSLVMIVDIGAGTSDFGLYRVRVDPDGTSQGREALMSSRVITEAGNHLDNLLIEFILKNGEVTSEHPGSSVTLRRKLNLRIREYKEILFEEGEVSILEDPLDLTILLKDFSALTQVREFGDSLLDTMIDILETVDESWVNWVRVNPKRRLVVMLTGGGAKLPMVQNLVQDPLLINGQELRVVRAKDIPAWLEVLDDNVAADYPRVAVSLGGARKRLMERKTAIVTAGDVTGPPALDRY